MDRYVDSLIEDMIPTYEGYYETRELVGYVLIMCSFTGEGGEGWNPWALMMVLDDSGKTCRAKPGLLPCSGHPVPRQAFLPVRIASPKRLPNEGGCLK